MRAIQIHGPNQVSVDEVPDPTPGPRDVLVRIHACGVCGTDLGYVSRGGLAGPGPQPLALGHEMSGIVASVGHQVTTVAVGDRVVVHPGDDKLGRIGNGAPEGGLADMLLVREAKNRLVKVPDDVDLTVAALTEPVAVGMHAAERLDLALGGTAVVMGCGPVGMAAVSALLDQGASSVVAVDPGSTRREIALKLGATAALDPYEPGLWGTLAALHGAHATWTESPATNGFVETSGSVDVLTQIIANAAPRSRISIPAVYMNDVPLSVLLLMMKELELRGAIEYPDRFEDALDLIRRRDLSPMLTDLLDLDEVAFRLVDQAGMRATGKTIALLGKR